MIHQRGFTLLEVIIAFAILTLSLATIYEIFRLGLRGTRVSRAEQTALEIAEHHLTEMGTLRPLQPSRSEGVEAGVYHWTETATLVEPTDDPVPYTVPAYQISVGVSWPSGVSTRTLQLDSVRLSPKRRSGT